MCSLAEFGGIKGNLRNKVSHKEVVFSQDRSAFTWFFIMELYLNSNDYVSHTTHLRPMLCVLRPLSLGLLILAQYICEGAKES